MHEKNNIEKEKNMFKMPIFELCLEQDTYHVCAYIRSNGTHFSDIYDRKMCVGTNEIQTLLGKEVKVLGEVIRFGI